MVVSFTSIAFYVLFSSCYASGVKFGEAQSYHTAVRAYDMKEGRLSYADKLVVAKFTQLGIVTSEEEPHIIAGSAFEGYEDGRKPLFHFITGFIELNNSMIVAVDRRNHCLRAVHVETGDASTFAGLCKSSGNLDGDLLSARFDRPSKIVGGLYSREYYLTDTYNDAVRLLKEEEALVETVVKGIQKPNAIALDYSRKRLLVTCLYGIAIIDLTQSSVSYLKNFGLNSAVKAFGESLALLTLMPEVYVVGDYTNKKVFMLNTRNNGSEVTVIANVSVYSAALSNARDKLYLGLAESIIYLPVTGLEADSLPHQLPPRPTTTTTTPTTSTEPANLPTNSPIVHTEGFMNSWSLHIIIAQGALIVFLILAVAVLLYKWWRRPHSKDDDSSLPSHDAPPPPDNSGYEVARPNVNLETAAVNPSQPLLEQPNVQLRPASSSDRSQSAGYEVVEPPERR